MISAKFGPSEILYTLIATAASNLIFSWVFESANFVTRPDRRNAKMVYSIPVRSGKRQTTTLGLASHSRNDKGLWPVIISPVYGKTPHFALCCIMSPLDRDVTYPHRCQLMGGNWQKWKRVFLTCPCHEIYRDEAVGLKSCKYIWKITIFVKMWNFGAISWKFDIL